MPSFEKLNVLLCKTQASLGTKQTALTSTADLLLVGQNGGPWLDYKPEFSEFQVANGVMGQEPKVMGTESVDIKFQLPIIPTGSVTAPIVEKPLLASGMAVTVATNKRTYTPSSLISDWKDLTFWEYTGDASSGDSLLTKCHSAMLDWKFTGEIGKPALLDFTGPGVPDGAPAAATRDAGPYSTSLTAIPAILKATVMTVGGKQVKLMKFGVEMKNDIKLIPDPSTDHGWAQAMLMDRAISWSATFFQSNLNPDSVIPVMAAQTLSDFVVTWGTAGSRITFKTGTNKCQVTAVKKSVVDGINMFECTGTVVGNDLLIIINDD